jgi:hypothetical protein
MGTRQNVKVPPIWTACAAGLLALDSSMREALRALYFRVSGGLVLHTRKK